MAAVSTCSATPPPCFALPLFAGAGSSSTTATGPSSSPPVLPCVPPSLEQRLRALRRMSESSSTLRESDPVALPPRRRVSESALDHLESLMANAAAADDGFTTPRVIYQAPLKTPPTPGRRKRPVPAGKADLPEFLPVGIRARAAAKSSTAAAPSSPVPTKPARAHSSAPPSPKRLRTAPRYECPWLASFAAASAAVGDSSGDRDNGKAGEKTADLTSLAAASNEAVDAKLLGALQNAARVMEISAPNAAEDDCKSEASDLSCDEDRPEVEPRASRVWMHVLR